MTPLYLYNGKLLTKNGALATSENCCCPSGDSCQYLSCVSIEWDLEYLDPFDNQWYPNSGSATYVCNSTSKQLITLSLSSCFGSGANAEVTAPVGYQRSDMGPISATSVNYINLGSPYAIFGRSEPSLSVGGGTGTGLTVTPTLESVNGDCNIPYWTIKSVSFSGGEDYINNEALTVNMGPGDESSAPATLRVQTDPRSQPTLSASVSGGTGAILSVTTSLNIGSDPQTWGVSKVTVTGNTSGYTDDTPVVFSYGDNVTEQTKAQAYIATARYEPTIKASVPVGSGAILSVNLNEIIPTPPNGRVWTISSVTINNGGSGYVDQDGVIFTVTDGTEATPASAFILTDRENPNLTPYVWGANGVPAGSGAVLTATMNQILDQSDRPAWEVSNINIVNGGENYVVGEYIWYTELDPNGIAGNPPYYVITIDGWQITSVDNNGAITGLGIDPNIGSNGVFYKSYGIIEAVNFAENGGGSYYKNSSEIGDIIVTNPGAYYYYTGIPTNIIIENGGEYYHPDANLPPIVANVVVTINQSMPSEGTGAQLSAIVDTNTSSPTFGKITGISIDDGGDNYLAQRTLDPNINMMTGEGVTVCGTFCGNLPAGYGDSGGPGVGMKCGNSADVFFSFGGYGGYGDNCCQTSFVTRDLWGSCFGPSRCISLEQNNIYGQTCTTEGDTISCDITWKAGDPLVEVIRGTSKKTTKLIWFTEDCSCAS